jgi:hypothetical protein
MLSAGCTLHAALLEFLRRFHSLLAGSATVKQNATAKIVIPLTLKSLIVFLQLQFGGTISRESVSSIARARDGKGALMESRHT